MAKPMKSASSSATDNQSGKLLSQRNWRITGGVAIAGCAAMALVARTVMESGASVLWLSIFWMVWLLLLLIALFCVLLDIRYLRVLYRMHERELFKETLGNEAFRQAIIDAQRAQLDETRRGDSP